MEDGEDINNRKRLSWMAGAKYNDIWKNPYIKIPQKIAIYNTYVRSVLVYDASTWVSNVTINNQINIIHRKQLRGALNIRYPKTIHNNDLYALTKTEELSTFIQKRRRAHWGHVLRHDGALYDVYNYVQRQPMKRKNRKNNIFSNIRKDFGTDILQRLKEQADERIF